MKILANPQNPKARIIEVQGELAKNKLAMKNAFERMNSESPKDPRARATAKISYEHYRDLIDVLQIELRTLTMKSTSNDGGPHTDLMRILMNSATHRMAASVEDGVRQFFTENPNPSDAQVHEFAMSQGMTPEALEAVVYELFTNCNNKGDVMPASVLLEAARKRKTVKSPKVKNPLAKRRKAKTVKGAGIPMSLPERDPILASVMQRLESAIPKSNSHKLVNKQTNVILFEGNKAQMLTKLKALRREGTETFLALTDKAVGQKFS